MTTYNYIDRATRSSCSTRKSEFRKKPVIAPLPGFLPTSAESIRLALSLPLHGMPHDRVFGVYKEGYCALINAYLWDLCQFNHLIESFSEYLAVAPISLDSFSTGLVSFIKIADIFYTLLEFLIHTNSQELCDSVYRAYRERCAEQDTNLYSYELRVSELSQKYITCVDLELHEGIIKQRNRYKVAYNRLLEMYAEDIAAINRILGNIGAQFINDRNIVGSTGISPAILTSRLLLFIRKSSAHNNDMSASPIPRSPNLEFRSFDDAFQVKSSQSSISRKYPSPVVRTNSVHREREINTRSSTSYTTRRNYADNESGALYRDPIQHANSIFNIQAELMDVMSSMDAQMHSSPRNQQKQQHSGNQRPSAAGFIIRDMADHEARSLHDHSSIAELHGIDIGLQTEIGPSFTTVDAIVWTGPNEFSNQMIATDLFLQIDVKIQTEPITVVQTDVDIQTDTTAISSINDLNFALQNKIGFDDTILLTYVFFESLLGEIQISERQNTPERALEENGSMELPAVVTHIANNDSCVQDEQQVSSSIVDTVEQLHHVVEAANNATMTLKLPSMHSISMQNQSPTEKQLEHRNETSLQTREDMLTENESLWKQKFDPYLAKVSFAQCISQEISDGESSLQPIFDLCDQSSITVSTDGVVGTAILSFSRSFPEFMYDTLNSNSSEPYTSQQQLPVLGYVEETGQLKQPPVEFVSSDTIKNMHLGNNSKVYGERRYEILYNNILSKYMLLEEQSLKRTLETEELQAKIEVLTEEAESLRVELQRVKDKYLNDAVSNYGMIVQGSLSEAEDLSAVRYRVEDKVEKSSNAENPERWKEHCQSLGHGSEGTGLFLSAGISEIEKSLVGSEPFNSVSGQIACSVIRNDVVTGPQSDSILAESVIATRPQNKSQTNTPEEYKHLLTMQENSLLLQQLDALERNEKVLLAELNKVSAESHAKTKLNRDMQSMLSTIGLTVSSQLSDMEQLCALIDNIETDTFSLRPEIRKLQSFLTKTVSLSSHQSSSASFIDRFDD